ncbi:hypothetical protein WJX72_005286 [[Myrmecia] bisecta]|uniref:Vacuolar protein 8 n=1 Tax=[Myrmecia] bisecta TaxID=41462 RepID=A0AAW1PXJ3_9CHLO
MAPLGLRSGDGVKPGRRVLFWKGRKVDGDPFSPGTSQGRSLPGLALEQAHALDTAAGLHERQAQTKIKDCSTSGGAGCLNDALPPQRFQPVGGAVAPPASCSAGSPEGAGDRTEVGTTRAHNSLNTPCMSGAPHLAFRLRGMLNSQSGRVPGARLDCDLTSQPPPDQQLTAANPQMALHPAEGKVLQGHDSGWEFRQLGGRLGQQAGEPPSSRELSPPDGLRAFGREPKNMTLCNGVLGQPDALFEGQGRSPATTPGKVTLHDQLTPISSPAKDGGGPPGAQPVAEAQVTHTNVLFDTGSDLSHGILDSIGAVVSSHPASLSIMRPMGEFADVDVGHVRAAEESKVAGLAASASTRWLGVAPPEVAAKSSIQTGPAKASVPLNAARSAKQLSAGVKKLAQLVVVAVSHKQKEQAILKLYAVLSQAAFVSVQALDWAAAFAGLLDVGLARFIKHTAGIVVRKDKGFSDAVRIMAASILKNVARWIEAELQATDRPESVALVKEALHCFLRDGAPSPLPTPRAAGGDMRAVDASSGSTTHEADSSSSFTTMLDTGVLELLSEEVACAPGQRHSPPPPGAPDGSLDTSGLLGRQRRAILDTQIIGSQGGTDSSEVGGPGMQYKGAMRATVWLFKADQADGHYAAASLTGSLAGLGSGCIEAIDGPRLVAPLISLLRSDDAACKFAAARALSLLSQQEQCRRTMSRQDRYLRIMSRLLASGTSETQFAVGTALTAILTEDPTTHWVLSQAGIIPGLVSVLKQPCAPPAATARASLALKHLTASSQRNREALVVAGGLRHLIPLLTAAGHDEAQYNSCRILRHIALGRQPAHKAAALHAVVPLVEALKVSRPRVCFAAASTLAMLTEGHPEACTEIDKHGGIPTLVALLLRGGGQGKRAAAEALQACAAEDPAMKAKIAGLQTQHAGNLEGSSASGALPALVRMIKSGNLQQQAAAAGAIQALAYWPGGDTCCSQALAADGALAPLLRMLTGHHLPLRAAAAGALCNLALGCPENQAAIVAGGAIPALVELMSNGQPDGRYAAAASLYNIMGRGASVRLAIMVANALPPLVDMLASDSWYCRIVAADILACLATDTGHCPMIVQSGAVPRLLDLLCLKHNSGMLEGVRGAVMHMAYERGDNVIVMKGYKFAKAKLVALSAIACLADQEAMASLLDYARVLPELAAMLASSSPAVRHTTAIALADLTAAIPGWHSALAQGPIVGQLVDLVKLFDGAAAPLASAQQDGVAARLLAHLAQGHKALQTAASCTGRTVPSGPEMRPLSCPAGGYAITAKPSANLHTLLQVPFDKLLPACMARWLAPGGAGLPQWRRDTWAGSEALADVRSQSSHLRSQEATAPRLSAPQMSHVANADQLYVEADSIEPERTVQPGRDESNSGGKLLTTADAANGRAAPEMQDHSIKEAQQSLLDTWIDEGTT